MWFYKLLFFIARASVISLRLRQVPECIQETFCDARYQPNVFLHANFILCKKLCCLGTFSCRWKHYLGLKMPAKSKFYLDPWFCRDCVAVWQYMWLACDLCDAQLTEFPHMHAHIVDRPYLVCENGVFRSHKKFLRSQNHISIWHPPNRDHIWNIIWVKKFLN